jgi:hypothetical protein
MIASGTPLIAVGHYWWYSMYEIRCARGGSNVSYTGDRLLHKYHFLSFAKSRSLKSINIDTT